MFSKRGYTMSTLRDVAKLAGVSAASVSRVLSKDESFKISDQTRLAISEAVEALNYIYVPKKSKLPKKRIGIILAQSSEKYGDPFFNSILGTIEKECAIHNFSIPVIKNYNELKSEKELQEVLDAKLDGIFLMESLPKTMLKTIQTHIKHIVGIDGSASKFNNVGFDKFKSNVNAMEYLIAKGAKRIAYIGGGSANKTLLKTTKASAYFESLRKNDLNYKENLIFDSQWDIEECAKIARKLLSQKIIPDAIFAGSDTLASVILSIAYELKISVPKDIMVMGFNNIPGSALTIPSLTTVNIPTQKIGVIAVRRMKQIIEGDTEIYNILVNTNIIERNSI